MQITTKIIGENGGTASIIECSGPTKAHRIARTIWLGDWTSYFSAQMRDVDPMRIEIVEGLKRMLNE